MTGYILGIDPGKTGGIIGLEPDGKIIIRLPNPITAELVRILRDFEISHVYMEKSQSMPKQGVSSVFTYAQGFGEYIGAVIAFQTPFTLIPAATWAKKSLMGVPTSLTGKARAALAASRKWPSFDFRASERCKKSHEGLVDAALIADYGLRFLSIQEQPR